MRTAKDTCNENSNVEGRRRIRKVVSFELEILAQTHDLCIIEDDFVQEVHNVAASEQRDDPEINLPPKAFKVSLIVEEDRGCVAFILLQK